MVLFPTLARETSKHSHFNLLNVCVSNTKDTEFRLSIALRDEIDIAN